MYINYEIVSEAILLNNGINYILRLVTNFCLVVWVLSGLTKTFKIQFSTLSVLSSVKVGFGLQKYFTAIAIIVKDIYFEF